jgi:hypothetical protein
MCDPEEECEKPENLKKTPEECTPEQIEECYGNVEEYPSLKRTKKE